MWIDAQQSSGDITMLWDPVELPTSSKWLLKLKGFLSQNGPCSFDEYLPIHILPVRDIPQLYYQSYFLPVRDIPQLDDVFEDLDKLTKAKLPGITKVNSIVNIIGNNPVFSTLLSGAVITPDCNAAIASYTDAHDADENDFLASCLGISYPAWKLFPLFTQK